MELLLNKSGQVKLSGIINTVIVLVVSIVVLFTLFQNLVPEAQSAGTQFSDATKCSDVGCFFNTSLSPACVNNSSIEGSTQSCPQDVQTVPLAGLFGSQGIIILLLMVFLFLIVIRLTLRRER